MNMERTQNNDEQYKTKMGCLPYLFSVAFFDGGMWRFRIRIPVRYLGKSLIGRYCHGSELGAGSLI